MDEKREERNKYSILIADDERWVLLGIRRLVEKAGLPFQIVGMVENGIDALELLMECHPDVLITDIRMPEMDGLELMEKMDACSIDSKVVFISGYAEFVYVQRAIRMGAVDYILKPIGEEAFFGVLEKLKGRLDKEQEEDGRNRKLSEEANIALCTEAFCSNVKRRDPAKRREEGRKRLREYMLRMNEALEDKNMCRMRIMFKEVEQDMKEGYIYIDQLALLYNQFAIRMNAEEDRYEYFSYQQLREQFGTSESFFQFVQDEAAECLNEVADVTNSLLYTIVMRIKAENASDQTALRELACEYGISMGHLSNLLKKELGMSFSEYTMNKRIQRAKELLMDDRLSVEEIAEKVGYNDYFYFTKVFKKKVGVSPSKYRKNLN